MSWRPVDSFRARALPDAARGACFDFGRACGVTGNQRPVGGFSVPEGRVLAARASKRTAQLIRWLCGAGRRVPCIGERVVCLARRCVAATSGRRFESPSYSYYCITHHSDHRLTGAAGLPLLRPASQHAASREPRRAQNSRAKWAEEASWYLGTCRARRPLYPLLSRRPAPRTQNARVPWQGRRERSLRTWVRISPFLLIKCTTDHRRRQLAACTRRAANGMLAVGSA